MATRSLCILAALPACAALLPGRDETRESFVEAPDSFEPSSFVGRALHQHARAESLLCGDSQIRSILRIDDEFDLERVKNIRFEDAYNRANTYLRDQHQAEARLLAEVADLEARWYARSSDAGLERRVLEDAAVQRAIRDVLTSAFSSVELALSSDCSMLPEDAPGQVDPYQAAEDGFEAAFEPLLRNGDYMVDSANGVHKNCVEVLKAALDSGACQQLCRALAAKASALSERPRSTYQPEAPSAGELAAQIQRAKKRLEGLRTEIKECEATRSGIQGYERRLTDIGAQHDMHGRLAREAQSRLRMVTAQLDGARRSSESQQKLLGELLQVVAKSEQQEGQVRDALAQSKAQQEALSAQLAAGRAGLGRLGEALRLSRRAASALQGFKARAVLAMQSFVQLYNDAVRAPLRVLGLAGALEKLTDDLWPDVKGEGEARHWAVPERYAEELQVECGDVAAASTSVCPLAEDRTEEEDRQLGGRRPLRELCGAGRSLEALCQVADARSYVAGVRDAVSDKQHAVRDWLHGLRVELDELANSGVDAAGEKRHVELGEPEYLRRFSSALGGTKFYQDLVAGWALADGEHGQGKLQDMSHVMAGVVEQLASKAAQELEHLRLLNAEWVASINKDTELHQQLTAISDALVAETRTKIQAETKLEELKKEIQSKEEEQKQFQSQLHDLTIALEALKDKLRGEYSHFRADAEVAFASGTENSMYNTTDNMDTTNALLDAGEAAPVVRRLRVHGSP